MEQICFRWNGPLLKYEATYFKVIAFSGVSIHLMLDAGAQVLRRLDTLILYYLFIYLLIYLFVIAFYLLVLRRKHLE